MELTERQLKILKEIKNVTKNQYIYSEQMISIAIWIESEFVRKNGTGVKQCQK